MRILIVDSDPLVARLMQSKFEKWGHTVEVKVSGAEAFDAIKHSPFRMVIMEWDLNGMTGPQLCKAIRDLKRVRYTYIVFYTAKSDKDSLMAALESGADVYLTKPLNTIELWLRLKNGKRLLNIEDELREGPGADQTTGAVNRASFREFFRVILAESRRTKSTGSLLFVNVDNYNSVFAHHGYGPAQAIMAETAKILEANTRNSDLLARTGDNEFCLLLQNTYWDKCQPVSEKISQQLHSISVYFESMTLSVEATLSVINYPQEDTRYDELLERVERKVIMQGIEATTAAG